MSMEDYDYLFKIVLIGNAGVGKTCLVRRFTQGLFPPGQGATIGVDFMIKTVEIKGEKVKLQIWDTAGQERFRSITQSYYRSANALILTYDITCEDSFRCLPEWLREIEQYANNQVVTILVGNKIDLAEKREVLRQRAEDFADAQSMLYLETSAKESDNVEKLFLDLACELIREAKQNKLDNNDTAPMPGEVKWQKLPVLGQFSLNISIHQQYYASKKLNQIDHFGFLEDGTFKQRYLVADKHWLKPGGPVLFYTGNEGDIAWFCNNTGFMWDVAEELGAMLVFAEHRYYGESLPFGQDSYSDSKHLNYLTAEQALADFAVLIQHLKSTVPGARHSPVIAVGGSYGGMLAAWFRMKYPNIVIGALAASAPIWQFPGMVPCGDFYKIVTQDFARSGYKCDANIRKSWGAINNVSSTASGLQWLSEEFSLCTPLKNVMDVVGFKNWLQETWVNLAMVDYPYEASFLQPLPRWPIQVVCKNLAFDSTVSDYQLLHGVSQAAKVYYNYTGSSSCLNISQTATGNLGILGWTYQACTEMVMPMCTDGVQDMFEPEEWNFQAFSDECNAMFGVRPRADWAGTVFGGKDIASHSNIIFSNGGLDPWTAGGVTHNISDSLVSIMIPDGAHHLDLRYSNEKDPPSVRAARVLELKYFHQWIKQAAKTLHRPRHL
ncbi:hypothetical protein PAMP_018293 [Pampus punctatissimus]